MRNPHIVEAIRSKYAALLDDLDERGRRRWAAVEARALRRGRAAAPVGIAVELHVAEEIPGFDIVGVIGHDGGIAAFRRGQVAGEPGLLGFEHRAGMGREALAPPQ